MDIRGNFSDVAAFFDKGNQELAETMASVGEEAVAWAVANGNYQNQTGKLRTSNHAKATDSGLELTNDAPYASFVEKKGFEVLSGAALEAERRLKELVQ
jgi:hypothetical protein